ncbi:hypothetical protein ACU8MX_14810 [Rhizobium leguminosarum]
MSAALDFADSHLGSWLDGQPEFGDNVLAVVSWRGKNTAYLFDRGFYDEFTKWISDKRGREGYPRLRLTDDDETEYSTFDESEHEHLERIDCRISDLRQWVSNF